MKKLVLALSVFILLLFLGILSSNYYGKSSKELSNFITNASIHVTKDDWKSAEDELNHIDKLWSKTEKKWAMLIDHFEIDNIEMSLNKSKEYIDTKDKPLALAELKNLEFMVKHIYKKEVLNLENVF